MKVEDFNRHIDNILIDGLIKEAEQDNADFENAMRHISEEDFDEIVIGSVVESMTPSKWPKPEIFHENHELSLCHDMDIIDEISPVTAIDARTASPSGPLRGKTVPGLKLCKCSVHSDHNHDDMPKFEKFRSVEDTTKPPQKTSRLKALRPWLVAYASAACIVLLFVFQNISFLNGKLCDSAIYMTEAYVSVKNPDLDLSTATKEQIKKVLPDLEARYKLLRPDPGQRRHGYGRINAASFIDTAWNLAYVYLRLHKKNDAIAVIEDIERQTKGTPMGAQCAKILLHLR